MSEEIRKQIEVIRKKLEDAEAQLRAIFYELAKLSALIEKEEVEDEHGSKLPSV